MNEARVPNLILFCEECGVSDKDVHVSEKTGLCIQHGLTRAMRAYARMMFLTRTLTAGKETLHE